MSTPPHARVGFAVLYRWRVHPEKVEAMRDAWRQLTIAIARERGGLGSRLHRLGDGWFGAYAQWPNREVWERARDSMSADPVRSGYIGNRSVLAHG